MSAKFDKNNKFDVIEDGDVSAIMDQQWLIKMKQEYDELKIEKK